MDNTLNTAADTPEIQAAPDTGTESAAPVTADQGDQGQAASGGDGLILGRYKSVEDLANAYTNLQAEYTRLKQQQSQMQLQQPVQSQGIDPALLNEAFQYAWEQNPLAVIQNVARQATQQALAPVASQLVQIQRENAIRTLALNHADDIAEVAPHMVQVLQQTPQLWDMPNGLELAYQAAKAQWLEQNANRRASNIAQQQMADTVRSQAIAAGGAQPAPEPDPVAILKQAIRQGTVPA